MQFTLFVIVWTVGFSAAARSFRLDYWESAWGPHDQWTQMTTDNVHYGCVFIFLPIAQF